MIPAPDKLKTMRGEQVFELVRAILANEAVRARGFGRDTDGVAVAAALGAACDIVTGIIAEGKLNEQLKKSPPEWVRSERDRVRFRDIRSETDRLLKVLAGQARAALMQEHKEAGGDGMSGAGDLRPLAEGEGGGVD